MLTYNLLKETNTVPSGRGSQSGYCLCPLCKSTKLFARGRGINTHLNSKHKLTNEEFMQVVKQIEDTKVIWKEQQVVQLDQGIQFARDNKLAELQNLITKGWKVTTQDKNGSNALHWASGQGHMDIIKLLIETHGMDPKLSYKEKDGRTPMHWASRNGKLEVVKYFLQINVPVDIKTKDGTTPLQLSCYGGDIPTAQYLISQGADLSHINQYMCSVAHWVAMGGSAPMAQYLLDQNVDFFLKQKEGLNSIHQDKMQFIKLLLRVDPAILKDRDSSGFMPYELAEMSGHDETKKFLQQSTKIKRVKM